MIGKKRKKTDGRIYKWFSFLALSMVMVIQDVRIAFAGEANYAENAGNWIKDQLFWIGLIVILFILITCLLKRNWVGAAIDILGGAIILFFIKNPTVLGDIGDKLAPIFFPQ